MKKRYIIITIALVLLIVCLGAGLAFAYFFTDTFKSNKELFFKYVSKNSEITELFNNKDLKAYFEKQNTTPYTSTGTITTNVTFPDSSQANLATAIQNSSITYTGKTDKTKNYLYRNINANYNDSNSLNFEFVQKSDVYAIKINEVLGKFIGLKNENLKELCNKMGISEEISSKIPDKLTFLQDSSTNIISSNDISQLKDKYTKIIIDNITDDMFSQEQSNNNNVYILTLNKKQYQKIALEIAKAFKDDDVIFNNVKNYMISNLNISEEDANTLINNFKEELQSMLDSVTSSSQDSTETGNEPSSEKISIKVYVEKRKLQKTEFVYEAPNNSSFQLSIIKNDDSVRVESLVSGINNTIANSDFSSNQSNSNAQKLMFYIQKIQSDNEIKYDISFSNNDEQLIDLILAYNGVNTDQIQESSELSFDLDYNTIGSNILANNTELSNADNIINSNTTSTSSKLKFVCKHTNSKMFGADISKDEIPNSNIMLINSAPNSTAVINLFNQASSKFIQLNSTKMAPLGLKNGENPFLYYIPSFIPVGLTAIIQNKNNIL